MAQSIFSLRNPDGTVSAGGLVPGVTNYQPSAPGAFIPRNSDGTVNYGGTTPSSPIPSSGSPIGSSAGVLMGMNSSSAMAAALKSIGINSGGVAGGNSSGYSFGGQPISPTAYDYINTNMSGAASARDTAIGNSQSQYTAAVNSINSQLSDAVSSLTDSMNTEVEGTKAQLLAQNPYANPDDPNVTGYLDEIRSRYQDQIQNYQNSANSQIALLQAQHQSNVNNANMSFQNLASQITSQGFAMSESEFKDMLTAQKDQATQFFQTANTFAYPSNQNLDTMKMGDLFNNYQALFDAAGIDTSQLAKYSNLKVSDFMTLGGSQLNQKMPGSAISFNGVLSSIKQGTAKSTQLDQSQQRIDQSNQRMQETEALATQRLGLETERLAWEISKTGTPGSLSSKQLLVGSNNAGLSLSDFKSLDPQIQDWYSQLTKPGSASLNQNLALVKSGKKSVADFQNFTQQMGFPQPVQDYLNGMAQNDAPASDTSSTGNWWNQLMGSFSVPSQ